MQVRCLIGWADRKLSDLSPDLPIFVSHESPHRGCSWENVRLINDAHDDKCKDDQQGKKNILERASVGEPARRIEVKGDQQR